MAMDKPAKSNVSYVFGIESIQRKWALRKEKANKEQRAKYFGSQVVTVENKYGVGPRNIVFVRKNFRVSPIREDEAIARELFTQRRAWVKSRAASLQHLAQDQEDFLAQKNLAGGVKSMKAYYWKLAKAAVTKESLS